MGNDLPLQSVTYSFKGNLVARNLNRGKERFFEGLTTKPLSAFLWLVLTNCARATLSPLVVLSKGSADRARANSTKNPEEESKDLFILTIAQAL